MALTDTPVAASRGGLRSPGFKLVIVILLTAIMAVPLFFIQFALMERQERAGKAARDIAQGWGGVQTIGGPALLVPYDVTNKEVVGGQVVESTQHLVAILLPSELKIDADVKTERRWRGIFPVPAYRATVSLHAQFDKAALASLAPDNAKILWDKATAWMSVSDVHGLGDNVTMQASGKTVAFEPGNGVEGIGASGIHAPLKLSGPPDSLSLATVFALRGTRELRFEPLGRQTTASIRSDWSSPSFFGAILPGERRIGKSGFEASWTVPYLARGYGQSFESPNSALETLLGSAFGVRFYQPVDFYQLVQRSLKYAALFIGLAFLVFFVAELIAEKRLHAAQYTLIGSAQALFYLLLLSFAEHMGFALAYGLAAGATVLLTALYAGNAFADWAKAGVFFAVLSALYGLLYVILIQEDYALLIGALVLFAALSATMYATRKIDWSSVTPQIAG